ncbi:559_t:CDS:2 [Dentiscutata heterogama]|uniref:559_t:CDS:1 n=1 Tax=Dentiscutata heterogama TaxID=1316150 RepID=A0ACA9LE17_9GLOM|nr:559_t:CDS:2 [Dentiscutata heterogama]
MARTQQEVMLQVHAAPNQPTSYEEAYESETLILLEQFETPLKPETPLELSSLLFQCDQDYATLEAFKYVTDQYAETSEFKVFFLKGNNHSDGLRSTQVFACDRSGIFKSKPKDLNKKSRNTESKKCNCPWSVHLNYNPEDDKYYISQVNLCYNYSLISPQFMHISPANYEILAFIRKEIFAVRKAGISTPQIQSLLKIKYGPTVKKWVIKDVYNLIDANGISRSEFQAHDFLLLLQQKRNNNHKFSYKFELDSNNRLKHSNYFSMLFGVFTGVTNNSHFYCAADRKQYPETYNDAKNWALKVEKYNKDNEYVPFKDTTTESNVTKSDMNDLTTAFNAMKICRVDQNADQDDQMSKMKSSIKETLHQQPTNQRNKITNNEAGNPEIRSMNVCYFEINDIVKGEGDEYLMIEAEEGKSLFDIRNLGK